MWEDVQNRPFSNMSSTCIKARGLPFLLFFTNFQVVSCALVCSHKSSALVTRRNRCRRISTSRLSDVEFIT